MRRRLDLTVLMRVIEPARPDRNIALGGHPLRSRPDAPIQARAIRVSWGEPVPIGGRPARLAGDSVLVPHPANIRAGVAEQYGVGMQIAPDLPRVRPVVVDAVVDLAPLVRTAVVAITAVRAVEEDLEYLPLLA